MRRLLTIPALLAALWPIGLAFGQANNPASQVALIVQGPDATGNQGYPIAVVGAPGGDPVNVSLAAGGGPLSVTQGTSPWIVGQDAGSNPWIVNGTVSATQGTSPWVTGSNSAGVTMVDADTNVPTLPQGAFSVIQNSRNYPLAYNGATWDRQRTANGASNTTGTGLFGVGPLVFDGTNWQKLKDVWTLNGSISNSGIGCQGVGPLVYNPLTGTFYASRGVYPDNSVGLNNGLPASGSYIHIPGGSSWIGADCANGIGDTNNGNTIQSIATSSYTGAGWDRVRTPNKFNTVATAAAGNTALWTPAAGKKFRIMRWRYTVTDNATLAAPGILTVSLFDAAAGATGQVDDVFVPALALNNNGQLASSPWIDLGNGYLSVAANNVLNVNLSAALVTGTVRVQVCGTEE